MPELPEVETYRRLAERLALRRPIGGIDGRDTWYLKGSTTEAGLQTALVGRSFTLARGRGKLLMLDTDDGGPVLGLRFGMSGRLVVDGVVGVEDLWNSPRTLEVRWDRFRVRFADGGSLVMSDPRRLGGVQLDPLEERLGPDALSLRLPELRRALAGSTAPLKARLLDQAHVAGIGNLIADEVLWRAGLSPLRPAGSLDDAELRRLHRHLRATVDDFLTDGGSHTGRLMMERHPGGHCPKDHAPLLRATVGGRTSWYCPVHQK
jgi:formamidopyrimidine-DNA glycosylase